MASGCGSSSSSPPPVTHLQVQYPLTGIHKIRHVVIIMQENRSFDSYFCTYPGGGGIPRLPGNPGRVPCVPDPVSGGCIRPYHNRQDQNVGGPHSNGAAKVDIRGGFMN